MEHEACLGVHHVEVVHQEQALQHQVQVEDEVILSVHHWDVVQQEPILQHQVQVEDEGVNGISLVSFNA